MNSSVNIKFVHMADLHLGAPMISMSLSDLERGQQWKEILTNAVYDSFAKAVDVAINEAADFVIVSGDIFDSKQINFKDFHFFIDQVKKLQEQNIDVVVCSGNHDPYESWQKAKYYAEFPNNLYMFGTGAECFVHQLSNGKQILFGGTSFCEDSQLTPDEFIADIKDKDQKTGANALFKVGVLHTGLNVDLENFPVEPDKLALVGFDYWALGHIHKRITLKAGNSVIGFPGCIQGLHINAKGTQDQYTNGAFGINLVELNKDHQSKTNCKVKFVPTSQVLWKRFDVDVSNCKNLEDITFKINNEASTHAQQAGVPFMIYRVTLVGTSNIRNLISQKQNLENLKNIVSGQNETYLCEVILDNTKNNFDYEKMKMSNTFNAKIINSSEKLIKDPKLFKEYITKQINQDKLYVELNYLDDIDTQEIVNNAKQKLIDTLMGNY